MEKYSIGIDFGTLSARAVLVQVSDGKEIASAEKKYEHGVIENKMPDGSNLPPDWALQHPQDYLDALIYTISTIVDTSKVNPDDIIGVGVDFTACTILPVKSDGTPLCFLEKYKDERNAYVKLWKHHSAQDKAKLVNEKAREMELSWLDRYGGKISSEWLMPKVWQTLDEAPNVYEETDYFIEAGDWIVWQLTGNHTRNAAMAGYKATWHSEEGYPSKEYLKALDPRLGNLVEEKLNKRVSPIGEKAGEINAELSKKTGLNKGTVVAVAHADAHVAFPAAKIGEPGIMLDIIGTSSCHLVVSEEEHLVPGISGVVKDGIIPGYYGYEAGQNCVGDLFGWFVNHFVNHSYTEEAKIKNIDLHNLLTEKASYLVPGASGLVALDWWNGNRSTLNDVDLSGLIVGLNLQTKPEDIYRALIEATAFGTRVIVENFINNGVEINEFIASGGIANKNPLLMQIYADVLNMPVKLAGRDQAPALASAIFGTVAAGSDKGGYDDIQMASQKMGHLEEIVYEPNKKYLDTYDALYEEYVKLYEIFGTENSMMKRLKLIRLKAMKEKYKKNDIER